MIFFHEKTEKIIQKQKEELARHFKNEEKYNLLYDLVEALNYYPKMSAHYFGYVALYLDSNFTQYEFEELLIFIEDNLPGYELSLTKSKVNNGYIDIFFNHPTLDRINFEIYPRSCETIKTGKMIPERKRVCNMPL